MKTPGKITIGIAAIALVVGGGIAVDAVVNKSETVKSEKLVNATPPPTLPDGSKADNVIPTKSDTLSQTNKYAPKGLPPEHGNVNRPVKMMLAGPVYHYAGGHQFFSSTHPIGAYANLKVPSSTYLATTDYHTLGEIAVQSAGSGSRNIVEVGWNVDRVVNGDTLPRLFVYHWKNNVPSCYNGCGFVNWGGATITPGDPIPVNTNPKMGIQLHNNDWWISYNNSWVGYYPQSLWTSATPTTSFTQNNLTQFFGEVVTEDGTAECSDMGSGSLASVANTGTPPAASFSNVSYINGPAVNLDHFDKSTYNYTVNAISERTFYYGGPGKGNIVGGC